jgi:hypothetical protein
VVEQHPRCSCPSGALSALPLLPAVRVPPRPDVPVDNDQVTLEAGLLRRLGPDGWELADWGRDRDDRGRRVFLVKIYTDFGWAGFLAGSPRQIAEDLYTIRAAALEQIQQTDLTCASCGVDLGPMAEASACPCGTVAWQPLRWSSAPSSVEDALAYIQDAPCAKDAVAQVMMTMLLQSGVQRSGEYGYSAEDDWALELSFDEVAQAMQELVPAARWASVNHHLYWVIPLRAKWQTGPAKTLAHSADRLGDTLPSVTDHGRRGDTLNAHYLATAETPEELADRFVLTARDGPGTWQIRVSLPDPYELLDDFGSNLSTHAEGDPKDGHGCEVTEEDLIELLSEERFAATIDCDGWNLERQNWDPFDFAPAVVCDVTTGSLGVEVLHGLLAQAAQVGRAYRSDLRDRVRERLPQGF